MILYIPYISVDEKLSLKQLLVLIRLPINYYNVFSVIQPHIYLLLHQNEKKPLWNQRSSKRVLEILQK